jgi:hypothetical protein
MQRNGTGEIHIQECPLPRVQRRDVGDQMTGDRVTGTKTPRGQWQLLHRTSHEPVKIGDMLTSFLGNKAICKGGQAPLCAGSTGKVWINSGTRSTLEFYPSVYNLVWKFVEGGDRK